MPNPSKCISTAEMFFLKTSISAEWHTSDLVWLRQKGSLLILHPFFRYCIKKQLSVDPIPSSPNSHHKNCMTDNKENY